MFPLPHQCVPFKRFVIARYLNGTLNILVPCTYPVACFSSNFCQSHCEWVQLKLEERKDFRRFLCSESTSLHLQFPP